jgi:hypothetical protein
MNRYTSIQRLPSCRVSRKLLQELEDYLPTEKSLFKGSVYSYQRIHDLLEEFFFLGSSRDFTR